MGHCPGLPPFLRAASQLPDARRRTCQAAGLAQPPALDVLSPEAPGSDERGKGAGQVGQAAEPGPHVGGRDRSRAPN